MSEPAPVPAPKTLWQADQTHPAASAALRQALGEVMDPELGLSILQLGLVREVTIGEAGASILMVMTTPFCPYGPALMEQARQKAEKSLGMPVLIEMGAQPWDPSMMEEDARSEWGFLY
jgi:metal-sulfur cluster biosynthetic enzyme